MRSLKFDLEVRRHISVLKHGYTYNKIRLANWSVEKLEDIIKVLVYGYFTEANCKYFNKIFVLILHYYDGHNER